MGDRRAPTPMPPGTIRPAPPPPPPRLSADVRRQLRIEASAGELPRGTRLIPTGLDTFNVQVLDLTEADAAKVIRAVKDALQR